MRNWATVKPDGDLIWSEQPRQDYGALQAGTHWLSGLLQQSQNQGKIEGLAACGSQTTSPFGSLNNFYFERLYNFWGAVQGTILLFILCRCAEHRIWYWNSCACIWGVSMCPICLFWTERNTSSWSCCWRKCRIRILPNRNGTRSIRIWKSGRNVDRPSIHIHNILE